LVLALSGCVLWGPVLQSWPGDISSLLQIVAPATRTQVAGSPAVAIDVRIGAGANVATLEVDLFSGPDLATHESLLDDLTVASGHATGDLPTATLAEGLHRLRARAAGPGDVPVEVEAYFSYEPDLAPPPATKCEMLGQPRCLLPFPSNHFTKFSGRTDTNLLVEFPLASMPANSSGVKIDPTEWNRNDGFSPGAALLAHFPGVDVVQSRMPTIGTMSAYSDADSGVVVVDTATGERWPVWAEVDAWATSDTTRALIIRPARNFLEGHTYAVGLVDLRDGAGDPIEAAREFVVVRDGVPTFLPAYDARQPRMSLTVAALRDAGVDIEALDLAWDFTVASERNLSERVLAMRDDAYSQLGGSPPAFSVTSVEENVSATILRRVRGTIEVPLYLTGTGAPGSRISYGANGLPVRNGTFQAPFVCNIPRAVYSGTGTTVNPGRALVYGHGLLGSRDEVNGLGTLLHTHVIVGCATDWIGMASGDIANVAAILNNLSNFPSLPDRLQQSFVNFQFLAKLMKDANGFVTHPAFQVGPASAPAIATGAVFFNGNSQGGIAGGAATAISTEWTRAALGVPGINYSTLLTRSIHWDTFGPAYFAAYSDELSRTLGYSLIQMLWDRGEGNGYAHHLTDDPLPGTPAHQVLLIEAFGDHQVANVATETEARTAGIRLWTPALADGRTDLAEPFFGLDPVPSVPYTGSVLVVWDFGTPAPPTSNTPPRPPEYGSDPHGMGRNEPRVGQQVSDFLRTDGFFTDYCAGGPCQSP